MFVNIGAEGSMLLWDVRQHRGRGEHAVMGCFKTHSNGANLRQRFSLISVH